MIDRNVLGTWGLELPPDRFDAALLAATILGATWPRAPTTFKINTYVRRLLKAVRQPATLSGAVAMTVNFREVVRWPDPEMLAQAWDLMLEELHYNEYYPIRLELRDWHEHDCEWLLNRLFPAKGEGPHSLFLASPLRTANRSWQLPLRVGFLSDVESQQLRNDIEETFPYTWLVDFVDIHAGQENCNLLLLPHTLPHGLSRVLALPFRVNASCTLLLQTADTHADNEHTLAMALRNYIGASSIGLLSLSEEDRSGWFEAFIREWSHNTPLDLALFASVDLEESIPLLVADPAFIAASPVSRFATSLADRLRHIQQRDRGLRVPERLLVQIDPNNILVHEDDGTLPPDQVQKMAVQLDEQLGGEGFAFAAESGDARDFSELARAMDEMAVPAREEHRFLQARILEDSPEAVPVTRALVINRRYVIKVRIDVPHPEWVIAPEAFPDEELDFSRGAVQLTVVFIEPTLCPEPLTDHLELPASGPSTVCAFPIRVPDNAEHFHARIYILHRNRVLQGMYLAGQVLAEMDAPTSGEPIAIGMESLVGPGFGELEGRRHYDAALIVNHTADGVPGATAVMDNNARWIGIDRLDTVIERLRRKLNDIAKTPAQYEDLSSKASLELLRYFANHGRSLYEGIVEDFKLQKLVESDRIQVVSARAEAFLPLEFIYDGEAPDDDAQLCPHGHAALSEWQTNDGGVVTAPGQASALNLAGNPCTADVCPQRAGEAAKVICPFGFWSLRKVIERHAFDPALFDQVGGDFQLLVNPRLDRNKIVPLHSAVFAASDRVDAVEAGQRDRVFTTLQQAVHGAVSTSKDWDNWVQEVGRLNPSLLVLLPHTLLDDMDAETLEIGGDSRLRVRKISDSHVRPDNSAPEPVVMLLGCETGLADVPFESFVAAFRRHQAALVVTSLAKVVGRHAAPIAEAFIHELEHVSQNNSLPFGEIALAVRRRLVADGKLSALALAIYGDADWLIASNEDTQPDH